MAITVKTVLYTNVTVEKKKGTYTFTEWSTINVTYQKGKSLFMLSTNILPGFRTDGASIPSMFSWFLPKWDKENNTYNCGSVVHDCLYTFKGIDEIFSREECDDFIRGIWRCSGISRFKAGVADKCIEIFASGESHWGDDCYKNKENKLVRFEIIPL